MQAQAAGVEYQAGSQTLALRLPAGVVPTMVELGNPPRLVLEFPSATPVAAQSQAYAQGLVSRFELTPLKRSARVTLTLRQQLHGQFRVSFEGDRMLVVLTPVGGYPVAVVKGARDAEARRFVEFLFSPAARAIFEQAGFVVLGAR